MQAQQIPFPVVVDADRSVYRSYGLGRGSRRRIWSWQALRRYTEILRADRTLLRMLRRPTEDPRQLGGDFVIGPAGDLVWGFWGEGPDDRPTIDRLVAAVKGTERH